VLRNPAVIGTLVPGSVRYIDGRRVRVMEDPIPNAFPAIISEADWLAVRALKDGTAGTVRGRHAGGVRHLLAGLAECPLCGGRMTRVYKGDVRKAGIPKLVCVRAKTGAGCEYRSIPVNVVDEAIISGWGNLLADVPAGEAGHETDAAIAGLEAAIDGRIEHLEDLSRSFEVAPSGVIGRRIAHLEAELVTLRAELAELQQRQAMADAGLVHARLDGIASLFDPEPGEDGERPPLDVNAVNAALKVLFAGVTVDYRTGILEFRWRQGGRPASIVYAWPD
jgi:hypothetical protein